MPPSSKVTKILQSRSNFTDEEISNLSDAEAWAWVYNNKKPSSRDIREQICFTGFRPHEKESLFELANNSNIKVVKSVTKKLTYLCTGEHPGPSKLQKAEKQGAIILTEKDFHRLVETGELPKK